MSKPLDYSRPATREPSEWDLIPLWLLLTVTGIVASLIGTLVYLVRAADAA